MVAALPSGIVAAGCEPLPVLFHFWFGSAISGALLTGSVAFLAGVVIVKAVLFCRIGKVPPVRGFLAMTVANIVSTVPGVILAACLTAPTILIYGGVLFIVVTGLMGQFFCNSLAGTRWERLTASHFVVLSLGAGFATLILGGSLRQIDPAESAALYWAVKVAACFVGLLISIPLTICWEGVVLLSFFMENREDRDRLLRAVVAANLWTFFLVFLIGAALAIPKRAQRADWMLWG